MESLVSDLMGPKMALKARGHFGADRGLLYSCPENPLAVELVAAVCDIQEISSIIP